MPVHYHRAGRTVWRNAHDTVLVRPIAGNDVHVLVDAGADIWQLLAEPLTLDQTASRLADVYGISPAQIGADIAPLLDDLATRGVLDRLDSV